MEGVEGAVRAGLPGVEVEGMKRDGELVDERGIGDDGDERSMMLMLMMLLMEREEEGKEREGMPPTRPYLIYQSGHGPHQFSHRGGRWQDSHDGLPPCR